MIYKPASSSSLKQQGSLSPHSPGTVSWRMSSGRAGLASHSSPPLARAAGRAPCSTRPYVCVYETSTCSIVFGRYPMLSSL
jgi:hypothetical protein